MFWQPATDRRPPSWIAAWHFSQVRARARSEATRPARRRFGKQRRRQKLVSRLSDTEQRLTEGRVSVVAGGKRLLHKRHNLEEAGITLTEWRHHWDTK